MALKRVRRPYSYLQQMSDYRYDKPLTCLVCFKHNTNDNFITCSECRVSVHLKCYGCCTTKSDSSWKCRYCSAVSSGEIRKYQRKDRTIKCRICNQRKYGALKGCEKTKKKETIFVHLVCALWTPFIFVENEYHNCPVKNIEKCSKFEQALNKLRCCICKKNHATVKCRIVVCDKYFHPLCLMEMHSHCMIKHQKAAVIDGNSKTTVQYVYCPLHVKLHQEFDLNKIHKQSKSREVYMETTIIKPNPLKQIQVQQHQLSEKGSDNGDLMIINANIPSQIVNTRISTDKYDKSSRQTSISAAETESFMVQTPVNVRNAIPTTDHDFIDNIDNNDDDWDTASQWSQRYGNPLSDYIGQSTDFNSFDLFSSPPPRGTVSFNSYSPLLCRNARDRQSSHDNPVKAVKPTRSELTITTFTNVSIKNNKRRKHSRAKPLPLQHQIANITNYKDQHFPYPQN